MKNGSPDTPEGGAPLRLEDLERTSARFRRAAERLGGTLAGEDMRAALLTAVQEINREALELAAEAAGRALKRENEHPGPDVVDDLRRRLFEGVSFAGIMQREKPLPSDSHTLADWLEQQRWEEPDLRGHVSIILEALWPEVRPGWRQSHAAHLAARRVLHRAKEAGDTLAQEEVAVTRLERATQEELDRARETLGLPWDGTWEETERDGMTEPDARLADYARARWPGREAVDRFQKEARERLEQHRAQQHADLGPENRPPSPWRHDTRNAAGALAHILWTEQVKPALQREKASHAALAYPVSQDLSALWSPRAEVHGDRLVLHGREIARVELVDGAVLDVLKTGRGLTMHRLTRYVISEVFRQDVTGATSAGELFIPGGVAELARIIGDRPSHPEHTLQALRLGQGLHVQWPGGSETGGLWTYHHEKGARGRAGFVSITVNAPLRPFYALRHLGKSEQTLIPVVRLPPFVGRSNDHAAQADFQWHLVRELVDGRRELHEFGGVTLGDERLAALAEQAGLALSLLPRVLDRWTQDGDDGLAFLERMNGGRYHLADNEWFQGARRFLNDTAKRTNRGALAASKRKDRKSRKHT